MHTSYRPARPATLFSQAIAPVTEVASAIVRNAVGFVADQKAMKDLRELDDHLLRDIGLTRFDVTRGDLAYRITDLSRHGQW